MKNHVSILAFAVVLFGSAGCASELEPTDETSTTRGAVEGAKSGGTADTGKASTNPDTNTPSANPDTGSKSGGDTGSGGGGDTGSAGTDTGTKGDG